MRRSPTGLTCPLALAAVCSALSGCVNGPVNLKYTGAPPKSLEQMDWSGWGLTLGRCVVNGLVDYSKLAEDHAALDNFLFLAGRYGPNRTPPLFPTRDHSLAYAINCYNATVVRSVLAIHEKTGRLPSVLPIGFARRFTFVIDGRPQTPADLRTTALRLAQYDVRVELVLCDARRDGPPIPPRVFLPDLLDAQLTLAARNALTAPQVVGLDHGAPKQLLLWSGLYRRRAELIAVYENRYQTRGASMINVLCDWSGHQRRITLNSAVGYVVAPAPADARLNDVVVPPPRMLGELTFF